MAERALYRVTEDGWIMGMLRRTGETVTLHPAEAKYLGNVEPVAARPSGEPRGEIGEGGADRRRRRG